MFENQNKKRKKFFFT